MSRWFSRSSRVTDQYVPRSECDRWNHQRPPTRHTTPAPNGQGRSEYSANEKTGDTTQINGTRNPIHARVSRATSRGPLQFRATLTPRLRRPWGARMTTITTLAVRMTVFAIQGVMIDQRRSRDGRAPPRRLPPSPLLPLLTAAKPW